MSADRDSLIRQARTFAQRISELLNATVCDGVRLHAVLDPAGDCAVGYRISNRQWSLVGIPLTLTGGTPSGFLGVQHFLRLDDEREHLTDVRSRFSLYRDEHLTQPIFRYEYVRDNNHHPEAHLHVIGELNHGPVQGVHPGPKLHWPVGGRRFRPCLEDVVRFLILEGFTDARQGWEAAIEAHYDDYLRRQLRAMVRRYPEEARAQLAIENGGAP